MMEVEAESSDGILGEHVLGVRGGEISDGAFVVKRHHDLRTELVPAGWFGAEGDAGVEVPTEKFMIEGFIATTELCVLFAA